VVQAKPAQAQFSKLARAKWTEGVARTVECLLCKAQSSEFKLQFHQNKTKQRNGWSLLFKKYFVERANHKAGVFKDVKQLRVKCQ
jgi:hypothetical protein